MTYPARLLDEGEHVVVSTRTHPEALLARGIDSGLAGTSGTDQLHRLAGGDRADDGT